MSRKYQAFINGQYRSMFFRGDNIREGFSKVGFTNNQVTIRCARVVVWPGCISSNILFNIQNIWPYEYVNKRISDMWPIMFAINQIHGAKDKSEHYYGVSARTKRGKNDRNGMWHSPNVQRHILTQQIQIVCFCQCLISHGPIFCVLYGHGSKHPIYT